ncbi:hypothetical protein Ga0074812_1652 [Parafrankia irregularis]|uniref:Uncharacterized protein n=1 Tax=Parafrankia irregularis TaxID=795642 RepID=A0A0S4R0Y3_9ACTN|nr:hypothetical protein Ga0074812_1652 [Parafrankia irregularis]
MASIFGRDVADSRTADQSWSMNRVPLCIGRAAFVPCGDDVGRAGCGDIDIGILYMFAPVRCLGWVIERLADYLTDLFGRSINLVSARGLHLRIRLKLARSCSHLGSLG